MKGIFLITFLQLTILTIAHPGVGIVMDSKGNVFYTDLKQVWKIDGQGRKTVVVNNVHTHELYIDEADNLYGEHLWYNGERLNTWGHYVWRYSADRKFEKIIPDTEGFLTNYSFVRDHHGNMFWADRDAACQRVVKHDRNGITSKIGNSCFENIRWMTATPAGNVYLVDLTGLKMVNRWGQVKTLSAQLAEQRANDPHQVMGLSADKNENVFVAVYGAGKIKKVTPAGQVFTVAETAASWSPTGVLSAPNGDLWILECSPANEVRVERITKDGRRIIY